MIREAPTPLHLVVHLCRFVGMDLHFVMIKAIDRAISCIRTRAIWLLQEPLKGSKALYKSK